MCIVKSETETLHKKRGIIKYLIYTVHNLGSPSRTLGDQVEQLACIQFDNSVRRNS
jgi:hypothetical protein